MHFINWPVTQYIQVSLCSEEIIICISDMIHQLISWKMKQAFLVLVIVQKLLPFSFLWKWYNGWNPCSPPCIFSLHLSLGFEAILFIPIPNCIYTLVLFFIWLSRYDKCCIWGYSPNSLACWGFIMWIVADISRTITEDASPYWENPGPGISRR